MKYLLFVITFSPFFIKAQEKGVHFEQSLTWEKVKEKAKNENKYIFLDCYATWCGPCKEMDKSTYPDEILGEYMNTHFVSVRVQMDSSKMDNEDIKNWYSNAQNFRKAYNINGYPSFLFFSPSGSIVTKNLGYKNVDELLSTVKDVINQKKQYYTLLQNYHNGAEDYAEMPYLATTAQDLGENTLADSIATHYILNYLDTLPAEKLLSVETFNFLERFGGMLKSKNRVFQFIYKNHNKIDKEFNNKNSYYLIDQVIAKEEITPHISIENHLVSTPDWKKISSAITQKYDRQTSERIVLDAKVAIYLRAKDWPNLAKYYIAKIDKYGLDTLGNAKYWSNNQINDYIFMHSHNKKELEKGIKWMKIIVDADPKDGLDMDTYANLLYKGGRIKEAIYWERKAVNFAPDQADIKGNLDKMKNGKPTWPSN